jgi:predicted sugar kinase
MIEITIPEHWDTFINSPVESGDKVMLIIAMGMLDELVEDNVEDLWKYMHQLAKTTIEEANDSQ